MRVLTNEDTLEAVRQLQDALKTVTLLLHKQEEAQKAVRELDRLVGEARQVEADAFRRLMQIATGDPGYHGFCLPRPRSLSPTAAEG